MYQECIHSCFHLGRREEFLLAFHSYLNYKSNPRGVVANVLDYDIIVREFKTKMRYNVHFRTDTFGKCINFLILPAID